MESIIFEKIKRVAVTLVGVALVVLNKKLKLDLSDGDLFVISGLIVAYVSTGTWKAAVLDKAKIAGEQKAGEVDTVYDAAQAIKSAVSDLKKVVEDGQVGKDLAKL